MKNLAACALCLLFVLAPAAAQTPPAMPADGAGFTAWCGDAGHFAQCRQAVLDVNAPLYLRKVAGYPGCAIMVQDKTSIDHCVRDHLVKAPDRPYVFHLGAQAHVGESWRMPEAYVRDNAALYQKADRP